MKGVLLLFCIFLISPLVCAAQIGEKCGGCVDSPEKLCAKEFTCIQFPYKDTPECAKPDPCTYYNCPAMTKCELAPVATYIPSGRGDVCDNFEKVEGLIRCVSLDEQSSGTANSGNGTLTGTSNREVSIKTVSGEKKATITDTNSNEGMLENDEVIAKYKGELQIENDELYLQASSKKLPVKILPSEAIGIAKATTQAKIFLEEGENKAIYKVSEKKQGRVLFIFPAKVEVTIIVNAETGEIERRNTSWWASVS